MFRTSNDSFKRLTALVLNILILNQAFAYLPQAGSFISEQSEASEGLLFDFLEWSCDEGRAEFMPAAPAGTGQSEQSESESNTEEEYGSSEYQLLESIRNRFCFHMLETNYAALLHINALITVITEIPTPPPQV